MKLLKLVFVVALFAILGVAMAAPSAPMNRQQQFENAMAYITYVLMGLSVAGATLTILTFLIFSRIRTYPIKLICWLCLTIAVGQLLFIIVSFTAKGTPWCEPAAALIHFWFMANFCWCFCLSYNFYQLIVKRNSQTRELEKYYHLIGWGIPCLFVMIVGAVHRYGESGSTCYIVEALPIFLCFFLPGLLILATNFLLFFFVATEIHGTLTKAPQTEQKSGEASKELRVLISIFVTVGLSWSFGFLTSLFAQRKTIIVWDIFTVLFTITAPLQGMFIFVAYCLNKKVINRWRKLLGCKVDESEQTTSATASGKSGTSATRSRSQGSSSMGPSTSSRLD